MSAALVVLILIGMTAIVWSACFVGCSLDTSGLLAPFSNYQQAIINTSGLVACWPLNDPPGSTSVADIGPNNFNGTVAGPSGGVTFGQPNIVAGDTIGSNPSNPTPCALINGGYVSIPWEAAFGASQFTIEAWVKPNWLSSDVTDKVVVASASAAPSPDRGFALYATPNSTNTALVWAAGLGLGGTTEAVAVAGDNQTIVQGMTHFLVVTYDGTTLTLWVDPADTASGAAATGGGVAAASGYVKVPSPIPFFIGMGRPDLTPPQHPFNGWIQDVAFYNVVLSGTTIETHYVNGLGGSM
jgi:hypothetical protein